MTFQSATFRSVARAYGLSVLILFGILSCAGAQSTPSTNQTPGAAKGKKTRVVKPPKPPKPRPIEHARYILRSVGTELWLGQTEYRNIGANIPDLFERFLHGDDSGAVKTLTEAHGAGIRFVRCFGSTWGPADFHIFEDDRARWFAAYDRMLAAADSVGITVVPSLLFNARMIPEYVSAKSGKTEGLADFFTPSSLSNALAVTYVSAIATRYRNDPRILFWEIGNEYNLEADLSAQWKKRPKGDIPTSDQVASFLSQIAAVIKKIDRKHLITSGNADMRPYSWHIRSAMLAHKGAADPTDFPMDWTRDSFEQYEEMLCFFNPSPLDIISSHLYRPDHADPNADTMSWLAPDELHAVRVGWTRTASEQCKKPLFVGEFGEPFVVNDKEMTPAWTEDFIMRMVVGTAPLSAIWAWEFDEGGVPTQYSISPTRAKEVTNDITQANTRLLEYVLGNASVLNPYAR